MALDFAPSLSVIQHPIYEFLKKIDEDPNHPTLKRELIDFIIKEEETVVLKALKTMDLKSTRQLIAHFQWGYDNHPDLQGSILARLLTKLKRHEIETKGRALLYRASSERITLPPANNLGSSAPETSSKP